MLLRTRVYINLVACASLCDGSGQILLARALSPITIAFNENREKGRGKLEAI